MKLRRLAIFAVLPLTWLLLIEGLVEPLLAQGERLGARIGQLYAAGKPPTTALPPPPTAEEASQPLDDDQLEEELANEARLKDRSGERASNNIEKQHRPTSSKVGLKLQSARNKATLVETSLPIPKKGIRVGTASILRLAKARAVPPVQPVAATAQRPSGVQLLGVSGFGIGMQDGDVITHVSGVPVTDKAQIVNLVLQARARRAERISARFFRGSEPWMLVVELPYPVSTSNQREVAN